MRYNYIDGISNVKKKRRWLYFIPILGILGGIYILINAYSPAFMLSGIYSPSNVSDTITNTRPDVKQDRLYIPLINVDVAINEGDESALEQGAWHRYPENGDPKSGGNFVLAAHRFVMGWTPQQTRQKSPFYNIDKVKENTDVYVDYKGKRYSYKVNKIYDVSRDAVEIEAKSQKAKLTLYSCDLKGEAAGRVVVEAEPTGVVNWVNGAPKIVTQKQSYYD